MKFLKQINTPILLVGEKIDIKKKIDSYKR
jgi:hypothetical protein